MSEPTWERVQIIGIGDDGVEGLGPHARRLLEQAEWIVGHESCLDLLPETAAERWVLGGDLEEAVAKLREAGSRRTVVLALGDPLFFGTARYLIDRLGKDRFHVEPHVSSMQLAFARVKETWDDALLVNLAQADWNRTVDRIRISQKVGLFTTENWTPAKVATALRERDIDYFSAYVCEDLGSPNERVTQCELREIPELAFSPLNVMVLVRKPDIPESAVLPRGQRVFGNPDTAFMQSQPRRDLVTPAEVRALALAEMAIAPNAIVWDVGAGSGSVAIEAARLASQGSVFAIESDPDDFHLISANAKRFKVFHLTPVHGLAPEAWRDLPDPTSVFVDGTGRSVVAITRGAFERLVPGGRIVVSVGTLERLADVRQALVEIAGDADVLMINVARGVSQLESLRFQAVNPSFLVAATKPEKTK